MAYLTEPQLKARVGGDAMYRLLTDDDGDGNTDAGVGNFLLGQVDEIVNGFARRGGYTVPLAVGDVASIIPYLLDIANYKAKTRGDREASEDDRKLYDDAMRIVQAIADGSFQLPSSDPATIRTEFALDSPEGGPFFDRISLRDF